ncbi:MAG: Hypothetical protein AJITA_00606 [Acetilactobacillus jinshanensis]
MNDDMIAVLILQNDMKNHQFAIQPVSYQQMIKELKIIHFYNDNVFYNIALAWYLLLNTHTKRGQTYSTT